MTRAEKLELLLEAVATMRKHQRQYFQTRRIDALQASKESEARVDRMVTELEERQGRLL
jgi:cell fate (sporulation/competence/biofilm development) regulator YmcA (YheA/YmcA/DUF963 family)